jgi:S-adenosylmethionine decarboxylase
MKEHKQQGKKDRCCPKGHRGVRGPAGKTWEDLAPDICRQRMIVEGILHNPFGPEEMAIYSTEISKVLDMTPVSKPTTDYADGYGYCCFMHWKESGMHIYGWENRDPKFFSIDIYTCKKFDPRDVVRYTQDFFTDNLIKIAWRE